jgi:hypothetical protein
MGNIVSDPLDNKLILNSRLRHIITNWAKTDYDAGLSWGKTNFSDETINLKNILRKRACCTRQTVMNLALPIVDINSTASSGVVKPGYTPVKIRVFEDDELNSNLNACIFYDESKPNDERKVSYLQQFTSNGINNINASCSSLYQSGGNNLGLCKKIKTENMITYKNDPAKSAYGYFASDRKVISENSLDNYNNYTDCNCENSILRDVPLPIILGFSNINNREVFVQSNDSYCSSCSSNGRCYVSSRQAVNTLCINIAEVKESIAENASNINNIQTCEANNNVGSTDVNNAELNPNWAANYVAGQTTTTAVVAPANIIIQQNNNTTIFIIAITILVAIIIVGVIIFKLYKKTPTDTQYPVNTDTVNTSVNTDTVNINEQSSLE